MKCPRDGAELSPVKAAGLQLDKCHHCDGLWLDRGELEHLRDAKIEGVEQALEARYGSPKAQPTPVREHMRCPRCGDARLLNFTYTYLRPVSIDRCERCWGVWVDAGELDAIVGEKKTLEQAEGASAFRAFFHALPRLAGREAAGPKKPT